MFGLNREVLEGSALEPEQYLAALDSVTVEDVQRVAQDLITRKKLNLAVIGPFDDDERFLKLLA
jgi:predicted Zn-dependent peptidase